MFLGSIVRSFAEFVECGFKNGFIWCKEMKCECGKTRIKKIMNFYIL